MQRKFMELTLKAVDTSAAQNIYEKHMIRDFPPAERKPFAMIREGMENGSYEFLALQTQNELAGYAVLVSQGRQSAVLLDYYAVVPPLRGQGTGAAGLALLRQYYSGKKENILIESEYPGEAPDPALAERRLAFYARAGCRGTAIAERLFGVRYNIFSLDCSEKGAARSVQRLENDLAQIYKAMMPPEVFAKYVQFGKAALPARPPIEWE